MDHVDVIASFRKPPIVEVVCGVQFDGLSLSTPHIGLYWNRVRSDFPTFREAPPLPRVIEPPPGAPPPVEPLVMLGAPRVFFVSADERRLVQLQADRLHYNWQRREAADSYPTFADVLPQFVQRWDDIVALAASEGLRAPQILQHELTYLNHIPAGELWDEERGVSDALPWLAARIPSMSSSPEVECKLHFTLPACRGRLHVSLRTAYRLPDYARVLVLDLTVRGAPATGDAGSDLKAWFHEARGAIVRAFCDLTSPKAHALWEKRT